VLILAIAIDTLTVNMRRNLEQANRAFALHEQEWRHNRIIAEIQGVLLRASSREQIFTLVAEKTHQLIGDCICVTSMLEENGQTVATAAVHGFNLPVEKFTKLLGMDLHQKVIRVSELSAEVLSQYRSGKLEVLKGGLHALLMGQVPQPVSTVAQKRMKVSAVCGIGFVHETGNLGGLTILARSDISAHAETIELMVGMATLALVRKRDLAAQQRSETHYKQLFEESPDGVALISPKGVIEQANTTFARMFRYGRPQDLAGTTVEALVVPSARGQAARNMQRIFGGEDLPAVGYELVRKDGTILSAEIRVALLRNANAAVTGAIIVIRDISGRN
jgi:PAS domain S-box-containing protein